MSYDVAIIGAGPGGYVAAIRCAQLGMKTVLIEKYPTLGGTCLNVGCIPSKAVLDSSERFHDAKTKFANHGISLDNLAIDVNKMIAHKADVIKKTVEGVAYLMKKNKIDIIHGVASLVNSTTISVKGGDGKTQVLNSTNLIIATGSKPSSLPGITIDKQRIISSTDALALKEIPKHLIVVGGGVIGMELGSVYARIGSKVTVIEYLDSLIANMDAALGKELQRTLQKLGFTFHLGHKVTRAEVKGNQVLVTAEDKKGKPVTIEGDYCLMAVGRRPYTEGLNIEGIGINMEKGRVVVDDHLRTTIPNIYAIGDVIRGAMLAHKASEEGVYVAELIAGQKPHINYLTIPNIVYTWPEVASVGFTEEQLKESGKEFKSGSFPFKANARARMNNDTEGFIKVLVDATTDEILGIHMIGPRASDMIGEATVAMEYRASAEDISRMSHGHPTFYETFKEACLDATGKRAIHI
jgi:dihydrolipoamide dehydrogenase